MTNQSAGSAAQWSPRWSANGIYWSSGTICYEAIAAVFDWPNSPVAGTGVACDYLRHKCKRISEAKARIIHPALFERLDQS